MNEKLAAYLQGYESKYPHQLEARYKRILDKIVELWEGPELEDYFNDLMMGGGRSSRQGFPADVAMEIFILSVAYAEIRRKPRDETEDVWDVDSQAVTIAALNALPMMARENPSQPAAPAAGPTKVADSVEIYYGGQRHPWLDPQTPFTMGRDKGADLQLTSNYASRLHVRLEKRQDVLYLVDQSRNGTYVTIIGRAEFLLKNQELALPTSCSGYLSFGVGKDKANGALLRFRVN